MARTPENCPQACAREEQHPRDRQEDAQNRRTGRAEAEADQPGELLAEEAAVIGPERQHQAGESNREPKTEGSDVDERALRDDQRAKRHEHERHQVGGRADAAAHEIGHRSATEAEPEHGSEEDADPGQAEPDQLGMVVRRAGAPLALAAALPDPRGGLRGRLMDPLFPRHAVPFAPGAPPPPTDG